MKINYVNLSRNFISHVYSQNSNKLDKLKILTAGVALFIFALGIVQLVRWSKAWVVKVKANSTKSQQVFKNIVPESEEISAKEPSKRQPPDWYIKLANGGESPPIKKSPSDPVIAPQPIIQPTPIIPVKPPIVLKPAGQPKPQDQLSHLEKMIDDLSKSKSNSLLSKKVALFKQALQRFNKHKFSNVMQTFRLRDPSEFELNSKKVPLYFKQVFNDQNLLQLSVTAEFYDYLPAHSEEDELETYWVDFANASLGGGCFTEGFVQEEIMVAEMPDLANHIAGQPSKKKKGWCDIAIRNGDPNNRNRVLQGNPNPYLMKNVHRVQSVDNQVAYGDKLKSVDATTLLNTTKELNPPQTVNLLAIAAPKLYTQNLDEQWDKNTLNDLFNTLVSGFTLVKEQAQQPFVIHSGRIGCGAFNNNIEAVYLLHCLAAQHLGIQVVLHGYSQKDAQKFQQAWENIAPQLNGLSLEECIQKISDMYIKTT